ncbi:heterokaryon incompatibility protein-domain-containing protein [Stachybotrys elegans]|uniref:Heterokaryon incompatibility protein-domain-containing protein n=1 Tax=Stachybotrys elegans TaxID=80388 RepID=A0A8K0SKX7_9HYPO|nr:heterokaryon incompatibility protein-domain-containing protein [Stachybotrys elegans]
MPMGFNFFGTQVSRALQDLPIYVHNRLPPNTRSFRLFHFDETVKTGSKGQKYPNFDGLLCGRITTEDLDHCGDYEALSYCWEGSIHPAPLPRMSGSLSVALWHLKSGNQMRPLFVDQLCIDQGDRQESLDEKSQQVSLMGEIYGSCSCVVAWLDVATESTDKFFDWIPQISDNEQLKVMIEQPDRATAVMRTSLEGTRGVEKDSQLQSDLDSMVTLARKCWQNFPFRGMTEVCFRRWFRRVWIVQEACVGREMVLVCGHRRCSVQAFEMMATFQRIASTLEELGEEVVPKPQSSNKELEYKHRALNTGILATRILLERFHFSSHKGERHQLRPLTSLMTRFNVDVFETGEWARLEATNPRDYIYALRGLANLDDVVATSLMPDYSLPTKTIFTHYTRLAIDPAIDTLLLSRPGDTKLEGLPSWVPDWSANLKVPHGYMTGVKPMFSAGNVPEDTSVSIVIDETSPYVMTVKGVVLCEVTKIGTCIMEMPPHPRQLRPQDEISFRVLPRTAFNFFREVRDFCEWVSAKSASASIPSTSDLGEALWLTTTGGHGLSLTREKSLLGRLIDGKCLLGHLWELRLSLDVLPTIMSKRRKSLMSLGKAYYSLSLETQSNGRGWFKYLGGLQAFFFLTKPFIGCIGEDSLYYGVFGGTHDPDLSLLEIVLQRHIGRRVFASAAGHVGLVPRRAQLHDMVVILMGLSTPIVLRPNQTSPGLYTYVGEAYCHGFMHGEVLRNGDVEERLFRIE